MRRILHWAVTLTVALALAPLAHPQDTSQPGQGSAPAQSVTNPQSGQAPSTTQLQPDTHPLGGAYLYTLGTAMEGRNYLQPQFSIGEMGTNNPSFISGAPRQWVFALLPEASLTLVHTSRRNQLSLDYVGGGYIFNNSRDSASDASFHTFGLSDSVQFRRLTLSFADFFSYLPTAGFGFGGLGGLGGISASPYGLPGSGELGGINPLFLPSESILTSQIGTYNNTALVQAQYALSARTSFTAAGSYGILQSGSRQSGFLNENDVTGSGGIQHTLTPKDTIGVAYYYSAFHYVGIPDSFRINSLNFNYGRKITGRLALEVYGGPEIITQHIANASSTGVEASGFGDLAYALRKDTFSVSAGRYATGGSGILAGALTDIVSADWSRAWTRMWSSSLSGGYSRNINLAGPSPSTRYDYWYADVYLKRDLGRYVSFYLNYSYDRQTTNAGRCRGSVCAGDLALQMFGIGFIITPHPIGL